MFPSSDKNILEDLTRVRDELRPKVLDSENTEIFENFILNTQEDIEDEVEEEEDYKEIEERAVCDYSDIIDIRNEEEEDPSINKAISKSTSQNRSKFHKKQKNNRQKLNHQKRLALLALESIA